MARAAAILLIALTARADVSVADAGALPAARRWLRALARRDLPALKASSALPLTVRYPKRYAAGRIVEYDLDETARDPRGEERVLRALVERFPRIKAPDEETDQAVLGRDVRQETTRLSDGSIRVRFFPDYNHLPDGTFDEITLTVRRGRVHAVEVTWWSQR